MRYPKSVKDRVDFLDTYKIDETLDSFHIFHMYPQRLAYPTGYVDSRYFILWGFNTDSMKKRNLGQHDALDLWEDSNDDMIVVSAKVSVAQIFADGSTLIKFRNKVRIFNNQSVSVFEYCKSIDQSPLGKAMKGLMEVRAVIEPILHPISLERSTQIQFSIPCAELEIAEDRLKNIQRDPNKEFVIAMNHVMYEDYLVNFDKNKTTSIWLQDIERLKGLSHDTRIILYTSYEESSIWKNPRSRPYLALFPTEVVHSPNELMEVYGVKHVKN